MEQNAFLLYQHSPQACYAIFADFFIKTMKAMNHKFDVYESGNSPCKMYCNGTVTIAGHVFEKDQIGNFLFSYCSAKTGLTLGQTTLGARLAHQGWKDEPDDIAAYTFGHALWLNPNGNIKNILESCNIPAMQRTEAKQAWPSMDVGTGKIYPTYGEKK